MDHTVLMVQVENEVGILGDSRDRPAVANAAFSGPVPTALMQYLTESDKDLVPEFRALWVNAGAQAIRDMGGGLRGRASDGRDLYGLELRPLCGSRGCGRQGRLPYPAVCKRLAERPDGLEAWQLPQWLP